MEKGTGNNSGPPLNPECSQCLSIESAHLRYNNRSPCSVTTITRRADLPVRHRCPFVILGEPVPRRLPPEAGFQEPSREGAGIAHNLFRGPFRHHLTA